MLHLGCSNRPSKTTWNSHVEETTLVKYIESRVPKEMQQTFTRQGGLRSSFFSVNSSSFFFSDSSFFFANASLPLTSSRPASPIQIEILPAKFSRDRVGKKSKWGSRGDGFPTFCPANNSNRTSPLQQLWLQIPADSTDWQFCS